MRDMVFVSHANPEDNEFSLWLALQLATAGYPVWCDLTKLLGGEVFWEDVEDAIRHRTAKFLYVLSTASNEKPGPRNELALALAVKRREKLKDFVIPLWVDSLSPADFNVEIGRINAISFREGWARGLAKLVEKLAEASVARRATFGPAAVSKWWRERANSSAGVRTHPELLVTNWYPLEPSTLYFHELERTGATFAENAELPYPAVPFNQYLVSFAPAEDFEGKCGSGFRLRSSIARTINPAPDADRESRLWSFRDERAALTTLLRIAWERFLAMKGLASAVFASGGRGFYLTKGQLSEDRIWFIGEDGVRSRRDVVGFKTLKGPGGVTKGLRYWHFCLEAKPTSHPVVGYTMRPHVIFSDDGRMIWDNKERMHKARRSQCKAWWNDKWRDLITAMVSWLAAGESTITIPVGSDTLLRVQARPILLESPISYDENTAATQEDMAELDELDEVILEDGDDEAVDEVGPDGDVVAVTTDPNGGRAG